MDKFGTSFESLLPDPLFLPSSLFVPLLLLLLDPDVWEFDPVAVTNSISS